MFEFMEWALYFKAMFINGKMQLRRGKYKTLSNCLIEWCRLKFSKEMFTGGNFTTTIFTIFNCW